MRTLCRLPFRPLSIKVTEYLNVNRSCVCFVFSSGDRTQALNITDNCYVTKLPYLNRRPKTSHYIYTNISLPRPSQKKKFLPHSKYFWSQEFQIRDTHLSFAVIYSHLLAIQCLRTQEGMCSLI